MSCIVQISDTHFGTEQAPVLDALVQMVNAQAPELVVLSGDLTQRATAPQFAAARAFADRLAAPVLAVPGNHDIPLFDLGARLFHPYARYGQAFGRELEPRHASPGWLVLGVNTTRPWRHRHGEVSPAQVESVEMQLRQAAAGQVRVVVVHQPVAVAAASEARHLLRGHAEAVRRWAAAGADVVMGGHIHLPYVIALHERDTSLRRRTWCVQAGTAVSSRLRPGTANSVNVLRGPAGAAPGELQVERWDYAAGAGRFEQFAGQRLALDRPEPGDETLRG